MVFVAARWPTLVKDAVLLGVPPEEAAAATTDALSRCRRDWGRASRDENVDALVQAELMLAARRRPRTAEDGREQAARELLVLAPPTLGDLEQEERARNRAILKRAALIAVPLLLVGVGAGVYVGVNADEPKAPPPDDGVLANAAISRQESAVPGVVWYADGQLHLEHTVLAIEGLVDMTRVGSGVVYGDAEGRVVYAADDGSREVLGHKDPEVPVAATDENGWAAWVEVGGDQPRLVVKEAATGNPVASMVVDAGAQVVAVDGDSVYYVDAAGAHQLVSRGKAAVRPVTPSDLQDVRSRIPVYQLDEDTIYVVQSLFSVEFQLPGQGAELSPDGDLVATHLPDSDRVVLYDTRSGKELPNGVPDSDHVVAFAPGDRFTVTYVVSPGHPSPGHELELRTCDVGARLGEETLCWTRAQLPNTGSSPVLAR